MAKARTPIADRLWPKMRKEGDCWLWTAGLNRTGYGYFWNGDRNVVAHRAAYELVRGPVPEGLELDHLCRNRSCINPDHLEPVTHQENTRRSRPYRKDRKIIPERLLELLANGKSQYQIAAEFGADQSTVSSVYRQMRDTAVLAVRRAVEAAYREGYDDGWSTGTAAMEKDRAWNCDVDWERSNSLAALSTPLEAGLG